MEVYGGVRYVEVQGVRCEVQGVRRCVKVRGDVRRGVEVCGGMRSCKEVCGGV